MLWQPPGRFGSSLRVNSGELERLALHVQVHNYNLWCAASMPLGHMKVSLLACRSDRPRIHSACVELPTDEADQIPIVGF